MLDLEERLDLLNVGEDPVETSYRERRQRMREEHSKERREAFEWTAKGIKSLAEWVREEMKEWADLLFRIEIVVSGLFISLFVALAIGIPWLLIDVVMTLYTSTG